MLFTASVVLKLMGCTVLSEAQEFLEISVQHLSAPQPDLCLGILSMNHLRLKLHRWEAALVQF